MSIAKCEILWQSLQIRCIIVWCGKEKTFTVGELVLWTEGLFFIGLGLDLLSQV